MTVKDEGAGGRVRLSNVDEIIAKRGVTVTFVKEVYSEGRSTRLAQKRVERKYK